MCKLPKLRMLFWQISRAKCLRALGYSTGLRYGTCVVTTTEVANSQPGGSFKATDAAPNLQICKVAASRAGGVVDEEAMTSLEHCANDTH
eukprot:7444753-Pyramimonas_sp.AAC.2